MVHTSPLVGQAPVRFGWTVKSNNASIQNAIEKHLPNLEDLPTGYGVDDGRDYFVQLRRDQPRMDSRVEILKNAKLVFDWLPAFGVEGGQKLHEFENNFLAGTLSQMAQDILDVIRADLKNSETQT